MIQQLQVSQIIEEPEQFPHVSESENEEDLESPNSVEPNLVSAAIRRDFSNS